MDEKFKPDTLENEFEQAKKQREEAERMAFSFDEGVIESALRIEKLLKILKRSVYVRILGSSGSVGKSFLLAALGRKLISSGIQVEPTEPANPDVYSPDTNSVIFSTNEFENIKNINFGANKLSDLCIGIYRPDKRFNPITFYEQYKSKPDILICNEQAKDRLS